jgi:hypothetical protein
LPLDAHTTYNALGVTTTQLTTAIYVKLTSGDHINLATAWSVKQYPDIEGRALQIWYSENEAVVIDDPEDIQNIEKALSKLK